MPPTYTIDELRRLIQRCNFKELAIIEWLIRDESKGYTAEEWFMLDSLIMQRVNHIRFVLQNPWWFWLRE